MLPHHKFREREREASGMGYATSQWRNRFGGWGSQTDLTVDDLYVWVWLLWRWEFWAFDFCLRVAEPWGFAVCRGQCAAGFEDWVWSKRRDQACVCACVRICVFWCGWRLERAATFIWTDSNHLLIVCKSKLWYKKWNKSLWSSKFEELACSSFEFNAPMI